MDEMTDLDAFLAMAREFPLRTCLFTFALPAFALLQLVNGVVNDGAVLYIGAFAALVVAYTIAFTRYQIAAYRRHRITDRLWDES